MTDHTPLTDEREQEIRQIANAAPLRIMMEDVVGCRVALRELLAELDRVRQQRRLLLDQLRRKDARTGEGNRALATFVAGEKPDTEPEPKPSRVQCNDCGAVGSVFTGDDDRQYLDPSGQIGHQAGT